MIKKISEDTSLAVANSFNGMIDSKSLMKKAQFYRFSGL